MKIKGSSMDCAWATILKGQDDVIRARLLVSSLKRVVTSHYILAICVEDEQKDKCRDDDLLAAGFHETFSVPDITEQSIMKVLKNFKKVAIIPVDSIFLKNCDQLVHDQQSSNSMKLLHREMDKLAWSELENVLVIISSPEPGSPNIRVLDSGTEFYRYHCDTHNNTDTMKDCLENLPSIIHIPGLDSKVIPNAIISAPGFLEKEILNYWDTIYNQDILPCHQKNETICKQNACTWSSEPIAVIGTSVSSGSIHDAFKAAVEDSGLTPTIIAKGPTYLFTTASEDNVLSEFTLEVNKVVSSISSLECTPNPSSIGALQAALATLLENFTPNLTCLIFQKDFKGKISAIVIKRVSQAISNGDKIHAVLGPCSVPNSMFNDLSSKTNAHPEIIHLVEIVRFFHLRGPFVDQPWLNLIKLSDTHKRESVLIRNVFPDNSSLVVSTCFSEELEKNYPKWTLSILSPKRPLNCIALQQESLDALEKVCENLKNHLCDGGYDSSLKFSNMVYTLNTKLLSSCDVHAQLTQQQKYHRAVIIASDANQTCKLISTKGYLKEELLPSASRQNPKLCFLFTGQGSQYAGMAKGLYEHCPVFRLSLDRCNFLFRQMYNIDIHEVIWKNPAELSRTLYSQTSIFCVEYALLKLWQSWGIQPDYVVGHSLGEFCAAVACGALEMEDALKLVAERSKLIDQLPRGKMLVLRADHKTTQDLLHEFIENNPGSWLDFAAINSKDQTVLSGDSKWVEMFAEWTRQQKKIMSLVLEATHAFHSRHMDPILEQYRKVAECCKGQMIPRKDRCVYISGMDGKVVHGPLNADYWVRHTREPVRFVQACNALLEEGCSVFLECGPQPILTALAKVNMTTNLTVGEGGNGQNKNVSVFLPSIRRGLDDWKTILNSLAKLWMMGTREVDWRGFEKFLENRMVENDASVVKEIQLIQNFNSC